jgi:hypothetical protein
MTNSKYAGGYSNANIDLQMNEWACDEYFAGAIIDEATGASMEYRDLLKKPDLKELWERSFANELGRLSQGTRDINGTNKIHFIPKSDIPHDRQKKITYRRIVVAYKPDKLEKHRTRLTVGGERLPCPIDAGTITADVPTIKLLWNSTLSTPGAKYMTMDIYNF